MTPETVPCDNDVTVTVAGPLIHMCPFVNEIDHGNITITWKPSGRTFELHSLRAYLNSWADSQVSHEAITDRVLHDLTATSGVTAVTVESHWWMTAGFAVQVRGGDS